MLDIKSLRVALEQLEQERKIPKDKILEAIEQALAAAYKKEYGKKGQIVRAKFDLDAGTTNFEQVKVVVDDTTARMPEDHEELSDEPEEAVGDERVRFNDEHHILLEDAKIMKKDVKLGDEIAFPLEPKDDYGRIAAQTAKQVIIQRIREAERSAVVSEYGDKEGEIISGIIQKIEGDLVYVEFNRAVGILPREEQIPGEYYRRGERIKAYLYLVEQSPRGITLKLSRSHPKMVEELFKIESPEVASGVVEIKAIAREAGSRTKIAVIAHEDNIDPVGSCVGQRGTRVTTIMNELGGEKIDIIPYSENPYEYVASSLSPAKVLDIIVEEAGHKASVEVADDQLSLAIGKGGQNVRLAAKLTGWRIDIKGIKGEEVISSDEVEEEGFVTLEGLKGEIIEDIEEVAEELAEEAPVGDSNEEVVEEALK